MNRRSFSKWLLGLAALPFVCGKASAVSAKPFEVGDLVYHKCYPNQGPFKIELIESYRYACIRLSSNSIEKCNWVMIKGHETVITCPVTSISYTACKLYHV